jgi:MFS family permease
MTWREKLIDFFGLKKSIVALLAMVILVGLGEKMAERFLPIYLLALGGGILSIGFLNGMDNLLSALYSFPGGYLSDRIGYKRALVVFNFIALFGYLIVILFPHWLAVLIGAAFFLSWTAISLPATMSLVSRALPREKRTMGVSVHSLTRRIPMALGPVIGGILIGLYGDRTGIRRRLPPGVGIAHPPAGHDRRRRPAGKCGEATGPALAFHEPGASESARLGHPHPLRRTDPLRLRGRLVRQAQRDQRPPVRSADDDRDGNGDARLHPFVNFTIFPLFLLFSHSFGMMVVAFIIRGLKEFGEPTRKALIMDLAPEDRKAGMFGLYYLIRDIIVSGAAFAGGFLWQLSPALNLLTATACGVLGTVYFAIRGRDLKG